MFVLTCSVGEHLFVRAVKPAPTLRRDRSPAARNAARRRKANRERRVVSFLNRGASIAKIAAREGVTERGMCKYVRGLLARRAPQPLAAFLALQVSRLNEALIVAYSAMSGANLQAVDRGRDNRARTRPLSRFCFRRRARDAKAVPSRAALPGPSRARGAARRDGTEWRRKRLRLLDSRAEMAASEFGRRRRSSLRPACGEKVDALSRHLPQQSWGRECQRVDRLIAISASAIVSGRPTWSQRPSSRTPNSRPFAAAAWKNGASRKTSAASFSKSSGLMIPTPV